MNVILLSFGSAGDINPFVSIGIALKKRNHNIIFITNEKFKAVVEANGLDFIQVGSISEYDRLIEHPDLFHPQRGFEYVLNNVIFRYMRSSFEAIEKVYNKNSILLAQSIAPSGRIAHEKFGIPLISINLQPVSFWSISNPPVFSGLSIPEYFPLWFKRIILESIKNNFIENKFMAAINPFLEELGLQKQKNFFSKWLHSPQSVIGLFPEWFASPADDWVENVKLIGFIQNSNEPSPTKEVLEFISAGEPPIIFTAGSAMLHGEDFFEIAASVIKDLNKRAIFVTSDKKQFSKWLNPNLYICDYLPFSKIFPYSSMIVHHGGIGTTAQAIAAGKPQLITPFAHDQPDNAHRIVKLGLGHSISARKLTKKNMCEKINTILRSAEMKEKCKNYSNAVSYEKAMSDLVEHIEGFSRQTQKKS